MLAHKHGVLCVHPDQYDGEWDSLGSHHDRLSLGIQSERMGEGDVQARKASMGFRCCIVAAAELSLQGR